MLRKLHSLSGVVPVGVFLVVHLWDNARALDGRRAFDAAAERGAHFPYFLLLELFGIWLPLLFHGLYGVKMAFEARPNVTRYPHSFNWMYVVQRATGLVAFVFIAYHFWQFRMQLLLGKMSRADFFPALCAQLSSTHAGIPVMALFYLTGIAACVFHFANGLYGFCFSWGITLSRRATRIAQGVFAVAGVLLFVMAANTVIYFATGSRLALSTERAAATPPVSCRPFEDGGSASKASPAPTVELAAQAKQ